MARELPDRALIAHRSAGQPAAIRWIWPVFDRDLALPDVGGMMALHPNFSEDQPV